MALPIPVYEASFVIEDGKMEIWKYGNMEKWKDGKMERWRYYISELIIFNLLIF